MIPEKPLDSLAPCLVGRHGKPLVRSGSRVLESSSSEEELLAEEEEADVTLLPPKVSGLVLVLALLTAASRRSL